MWRTPRIKFFFQKIFYLSLLPALFIKIELWKQYDLLCPYSGFSKYLCFLLDMYYFHEKKILIMPQMNHPNAFSLLSFFFLQYLICEVLNFVVDVSQIFITDIFLGGRFIKYGTQVIYYFSHSPSLRRDLPNPMCTVFPTVTR